ncbi:MAG: hypothetical protein ACT4P8_14310 [Betaproteobacteria bacterium]
MHDRFPTILDPGKAVLGAAGSASACVFPLWPERWQVILADPLHPVWVSSGAASSYRRCLRYFIASPWRTLHSEALLHLNRVIPRAGILAEVRLPRAMRRMLSFELPLRAKWRAAIRIGTAGPRQRASVVFATDAGEGIAFARVAMTPMADARVGAEADNLRRLSGVGYLAGRIPRLLADGTTAGGRRYFVTTLAPSVERSNSLTPAHLRFLALLGRAHLEEQQFGASACLRRIETMLARLQPCVDRDTQVGLWEAIRDCVVHLSGWKGPFVLAQGGFAPSNVRIQRRDVFVCGWERARSGANPLTDLLGFWSGTRAASHRATSPRAIGAVVRAAGRRMRQLYPEWCWPETVVAALALACLIETMLQHGLEHECLDTSDPVIRNLWRLIEARRTWLAPF